MTGSLRLNVVRRSDGQSYAHEQSFSGALRVIRPHYLDDSGQVTYTVINPGGAYFGADTYELDFTVGNSASLMVTTQSATKVYRTPQGPAVQKMRVNVGDNATFEYLPDQLIVYRQGTYRQSSEIVISPTSRLVLAEIVTPGWSPEGEQFAFDELRMRTEVRVRSRYGEVPFVVDNLRLIPSTSPLGLGVMEGFSHSGQLLLAGPHIEQAYDELVELVDASPTHSGLSRIGVPWDGAMFEGELPVALAIRSLAGTTEDIMSLHTAAVDVMRARDGARGTVVLRKF